VDLSILKTRVKELEKEIKELDNDLEEKRKVLKDKILELERREKILFFVKRNGAENRKVSIPKRIKKAVKKVKILQNNLDKFLNLHKKFNELETINEQEKRRLIEDARE